MRNKVDFTLPTESLFLNPGVDPGISLLRPLDFIWRTREPAVIQGFAASEFDEINERIERFVGFTKRHKAFRQIVEINTVPVVLEQASFRKSYTIAMGKCILSGAAGMRLLNQYRWVNENSPDNPEEAVIRYFDDCRAQNTQAEIPLVDPALLEGLDFAIESRNTFNFYHFVTETLCQLCLLDELQFTGRVFIHFPNHEEKTRAFTRAFIETLFPELSGRVVFERAPKEYDRVISAHNLLCAFFQYPGERIGTLDDLAPSDVVWKGSRAERASQLILQMNSVDRNLLRLRERALKAIEGKDFSHLPKRFWVGRDPGQARDRTMKGEGDLFAMLQLFGFERVMFETLLPIEQIAIMANAEMMISYHGAGFTNMIFANAAATVIEIGTLQSAIYRWGDFWPLANVSMCRYISFFADYNTDDPLVDPSFSEDGIVPVALSRRGMAVILPFVVAVLGHVPTLTRQGEVARLVDQLVKANCLDQAFAVLQHHTALLPGHYELCRAKADAHKRRGETEAELEALLLAFEADQTKWYTLVLVLWSAKRIEATDTLSWALRRLRSDFPSRYEALVKERQWFLKYA